MPTSPQPTDPRTPVTLDDWLDCPRGPSGDPGLDYAHFMLHCFRLPAWQWVLYAPILKGRRLFVQYEGHVYRVTGASRLGDVWLVRDFNRTSGYDLRVEFDLNTLTNWSEAPPWP